MAEFALLPEKIQKLAAKQIDPTSVVVCAIGGAQLFQPDFILVTEHKLLVLAEATIGTHSYAMVRLNLDFNQIIFLSIEQTFWQKIARQSCLKIEIPREIYLINGLKLLDSKKIITLIRNQLANNDLPQKQNINFLF
tara:strand:- start:276 stop:686 length:411 start_codon:yes stop_codon:yes gene_type:complete